MAAVCGHEASHILEHLPPRMMHAEKEMNCQVQINKGHMPLLLTSQPLLL